MELTAAVSACCRKRQRVHGAQRRRFMAETVEALA